MQSIRRAVIDVGTNSTKLLVAEVTGHDVSPVWEGAQQTRLGQGFYKTHRLQPEPIARTARAVAEFAGRAREQQAASIRLIATSAARDALNPDDLATALLEACGIKVEIISGEQEAAWAFQGVTTDLTLARQPLFLLDAGGGSTQVILGQGEETHFRHSFPVGAVRLLEKLPHSDPPSAEELAACREWLKNFMQHEARPKLEPALQRETKLHAQRGGIKLVGTGGTASVLGCIEAKLETFDRERLEATHLSRKGLTTQVNDLWSMTLAQRKKVPGLPPQRADIILTGAAIYEAVMEEFGFVGLRVSTRGLRFAALMQAPTDQTE